MKGKYFLGIVFLFLSIYACRPDRSITTSPSVKLKFSLDTVLFDTVFTSIGSTTKQFKIYNEADQSVNISEIKLMGGNTSSYKINIDGITGPSLKNIELRPKDSLFLFVRVTINPDGQSLPFIVTDSIQFMTNGNLQQVQLAAYGQNAHFYHDSILPPKTIWGNDLPHVVYGYVAVDTLQKLIIDEGTKIHFHKQSAMFVLGTLNVNGSLHDSVVFQGDRLEKIYFDEPGQWSGIYFLRGSINNTIDNAIIKNSVYGVFVDSASVNGQSNLVISNSVIKHVNTVGLAAYNDAKIEAYNNLIFNCGQYGVLGYRGADITMVHNTVANVNQFFNRQNPSCVFTDYFEPSLGKFIFGKKLNVVMVNNIIWGSLEDEFFIEGRASSPSLSFEYNLVRSQLKNLPSNNVLNKAPLFVDDLSENYTIDSISPAIGKGIYINNPEILGFDLKGKIRANPPTIGCYEK